jgi:hypothetical protein
MSSTAAGRTGSAHQGRACRTARGSASALVCEALQWPRRIARAAGSFMSTATTSSSHASRTTTCHGCGNRLIGREWYYVTEWNLTRDDRCARDRSAGQSGSKRKLAGLAEEKRSVAEAPRGAEREALGFQERKENGT